jgi:hypothetical protein
MRSELIYVILALLIFISGIGSWFLRRYILEKTADYGSKETERIKEKAEMETKANDLISLNDQREGPSEIE